MPSNDESDVETAHKSPANSDSDSDFEAPGKGKKKRAAKSKKGSSKKRNTNSSTPKSNKCYHCKQRIDDNPNLVIITSFRVTTRSIRVLNRDLDLNMSHYLTF